MEQLPPIQVVLGGELNLEFARYWDRLRQANIFYPRNFVRDLTALLSRGERWTMKGADRWITQASRTFELDPFDIAFMTANDALPAGGSGKAKYVVISSSIAPKEISPDIWVIQQIHRLMDEWQKHGSQLPIVHEHTFSVIIPLSDQFSRILGEIPVPRLAGDLYWGTTRSNRTEEIAYRGMFCDAGHVYCDIWLYGGDVYIFQTFGISLWLVWPPLEENLAVLPGNSPSLSWCLENLTGLSVYFLQTDALHENPRINISHGSFYYSFTFTPVHVLYAVVYGPPLFADFARVTDYFNKVITRGAYQWEFSEWYALARAVLLGKRLWRHFLASIGDAIHLEHPILGLTLWETLTTDQSVQSQMYILTKAVSLGKVHELCESEEDDTSDSNQAGDRHISLWSHATRPQRRKAYMAPSTDLPFPDGPPTKGIHYAFMEWCYQNTNAQEMGAADNIVVFALFNRKTATTTSINPEEFSTKSSLRLTNGTKLALSRLIWELDVVTLPMWAESYMAKLQSFIVSLVVDRSEMWKLLKSDEFQRAFFRYAAFRHSTRVRIGGVRFQGQTVYQACVMASEDIAKDTFLWELFGVLSSDSGGKSCSTVKPHHTQRQQNDESGDRWLVGPARFCNHCCDNNAILLPVHNQPAMMVQAIKQISAGQEITLSYGDGFWEDNCLCEICTGSPLVYFNKAAL